MRRIILFLTVLFVISCNKSANTISSTSVLPVAPTNLTIVMLTNTKGSLSWTDNSTNEDGYNIERKATGSNYTLIASVKKDITIFVDSTMSLNNTYTYRVYSYNSTGPSLTYSNEVILATKALPTLSTRPISDTTAFDALTGGEIINNGGADIISRGIVWSTQSNPTISLATKTTDSIGGNGIFVSKMIGLTANTKYFVRAYATNSIGTSYGNEVIFSTNDFTLSNGLMAFYPFNGNANDISGNGNSGIVNGATLTTDRYNNPNSAYSFNGSSNSITILNKSLSLNGNFSISCWVKINNLKPSYFDEAIFSQWISPSKKFLFGYRCDDPQGQSGFSLYLNDNSNDYGNFQTTWKPTSTWNHIVATYQQGTISQISINGQVQFSTSNVPKSLSNSVLAPIEIGHAFDRYGDLWFNGLIDDLRVYNRVLTKNEISYLSLH
jgi:hypothetical protein